MDQNQERPEKPEPEKQDAPALPDAMPHQLGRNDPCHCGSGQKYKRCCLRKDEAVEHEERAAKVAAEEQEPASEERSSPEAVKQRRSTDQPWKRGDGNRAFQKFQTPRKRGGG